MHSGHSLRLVIGVLAFGSSLAWADEPVLPGTGWPAARYEALWSKSPFAVATPDAAPQSDAYALWGIAVIHGVSYASVTNKQNNNHYLLAVNQPVQGLTLLSITRGKDASDTTAVLQNDGQTMTLKMEQGPASGGMAGGPQGVPVPNQGIPNVPSGFIPGNRPPIRLPGRPRFQSPPPVINRPPTIYPPPPPPQ